MKIKHFSEKQLLAMSWWRPENPLSTKTALICDGAVRSGKTLCMGLGFVFWAFWQFQDADFAFCGKTIRSLKRNLVGTLLPALQEEGFSCMYRETENLLRIRYEEGENRFYLFGGKDEGSAALIQGITLSGVFLDETALMPRSFVEQALARCSVDGSRFWFNCNPEYPQHWFYQEWIRKAEEKNVLYLHFTMDSEIARARKSKNAMKSCIRVLFTGGSYWENGRKPGIGVSLYEKRGFLSAGFFLQALQNILRLRNGKPVFLWGLGRKGWSLVQGMRILL